MPNNAQLQQPPTNWSMHMGFQQPSPAEQSHLGQSQQQQNGPHKAGKFSCQYLRTLCAHVEICVRLMATTFQIGHL